MGRTTKIKEIADEKEVMRFMTQVLRCDNATITERMRAAEKLTSIRAAAVRTGKAAEDRSAERSLDAMLAALEEDEHEEDQ